VYVLPYLQAVVKDSATESSEDEEKGVPSMENNSETSKSLLLAWYFLQVITLDKANKNSFNTTQERVRLVYMPEVIWQDCTTPLLLYCVFILRIHITRFRHILASVHFNESVHRETGNRDRPGWKTLIQSIISKI